VSVGLVGVLIAASALSSEREDNALVRLGRGLVSPGALVAEKIVFAAIACLVVGLVLLGAVAAFTSLAIGRWPLWLGTLAFAGLGFGLVRRDGGGGEGDPHRPTRRPPCSRCRCSSWGSVPSDAVAHAIVQVVVFGPVRSRPSAPCSWSRRFPAASP
jgi:hypothetical protein